MGGHKIKLTWIRLGTCFVIGILIVVVLYGLSGQMSRKKNGFQRKLNSMFVHAGDTLDVRFNSYYVAGYTKDKIYLGNTSAPTYVLVCNIALVDTAPIRTHFFYGGRINGEGLHLWVDSPRFFYLDRINALLLAGVHPDSIAATGRVSKVQFTKGVPLSGSSAVIKVYDRRLHQEVLRKESIFESDHDQPYYPLHVQGEGIFSPDGSIVYDKKSARIAYVYYYRNEFVVLDTNLNPLFKGHTIDTVAHPHIEVSTVASEGITTMSAPPMMVNKRCCIAGNYLLVQSMLRSDGEGEASFQRISAIDVYSLLNGNYQFSFYLPKSHGLDISDLSFCGDRLLVFYGRYLLSYKIDMS